MDQETKWLLREKYHGEKTKEFFTDLTKLKNGEPLAYLIGYVPFLNTNIYLDSHPLIPRTETEYWVERAIADMRAQREREKQKTLTVLDLCAGSGCIGTAVLYALPEVRVDFAEIDPRHHPTIEKNIQKNGIALSRTRIFGGNLYEHIRDRYDVILTNPPYIDPLLLHVAPSVLAHEPHQALFGGVKGTVFIHEIISGADTHLTENGVLYLEHEPEQEFSIHTDARAHGFCARTECDQYGVPRYTRFIRLNDKPVQ